MRRKLLVAGGIGIALMTSNVAHAAVNDLRLFHLGESDVPPAIAFAPGDATTVDSISAANATKVGNTFYDPAGLAPGSSFAMRFQNVDSRYVSTATTGLTADFGIEAYVNPSSTVPVTIFYNGTGGTGAGLGISGGQYVGVVGTTLVPSGVAVTPGVPVELALVEQGPTNSFTVYVNDVAPLPATSVASYAPAAAGDDLIIGQWHQDQPVPYAGVVDEARIFQFAPGGFNMGDLGSAAVPEPGSVGLLGLGALAFLKRRQR
ncbi:MAG TPA: LamG-like jellyroll fold domain-containing protein [Tepidisphaeraceae bacterium]|jgi:hypothetical protein|nr:LamG-like jellyroll fold domain-containing protein [Tepidisphaeraceae bacterium]